MLLGTAGQPLHDPGCRRCDRLAGFLSTVAERHPGYFCKPVPPFGPTPAGLLIVGLAPGMHGANRTGRPFTGDYAGILLYRVLHEHGLATAPQSTAADDALALVDCRLTNAVKCLPPENRPLPDEVRRCNDYLAAELAGVRPGGAVLALGRIAHDAVLRALALPRAAHGFAHGAVHALRDGAALFDSYHCSRYNTNTRRLTEAMFRSVFAAIAAHLDRARGGPSWPKRPSSTPAS